MPGSSFVHGELLCLPGEGPIALSGELLKVSVRNDVETSTAIYYS